MWCTVQAKDGCLVSIAVQWNLLRHCAKVSKARLYFVLAILVYIAAQCNGIQCRIVYCALQCYQSAWQSAKVSIQGRIVYSILQG